MQIILWHFKEQIYCSINSDGQKQVHFSRSMKWNPDLKDYRQMHRKIIDRCQRAMKCSDPNHPWHQLL